MGIEAPSGDRYEAAIRGALGEANALRALHEGYQALRAPAVDRVKHRPADGMLICAHLAAELYRFSLAIPQLVPGRPPGCPKVPRPDDLLAVFAAGIAEGEGGAW